MTEQGHVAGAGGPNQPTNQGLEEPWPQTSHWILEKTLLPHVPRDQGRWAQPTLDHSNTQASLAYTLGSTAEITW